MWSLKEKQQKLTTWNVNCEICSDLCLVEYLFPKKAQRWHS